MSVLFSGGHSIAGQTHTVTYFGLYYTFPHPAEEEAAPEKPEAKP